MIKYLITLSLLLSAAGNAFAGTPVAICSGSSIQLQATKLDADKYIWSPKSGLDDSTKKNPTFTFANPGVANITKDYVVKSIKGTDTVSEIISITVYPLPAASDFTVPSIAVCAGTSVNFETTAVNGYEYSWDFGDGGKASGATSTHSFTSIGNGTQPLSITLNTIDKKTKCSASKAKSFTIKQEPDATIHDYTSSTAFTNCAGGSYDLTIDNSTTTATTNSTYNIDWGDGSTQLSTPVLPLTGTSHHYTTQGYFTIKETVTGQNGCIATKKFIVFNGSNPAVTFGNPGGTVGHCVPYDITASITGVSSNPSGTTYAFSTNENSSIVVYGQDTLPSEYVYRFTTSSYGAIGGTLPNSFFLKVTAENPCGISYSTIEPITTSIKPKADILVLPDTINCINTAISFTDKSISGAIVDGKGQVDPSTLSNWEISPPTGWAVSTGSLGLANPTKNPLTWGSKTLVLTFSVPGTYLIRQIVRNSCGNDTATKKVCIQSPISPSFTVNHPEGCLPFSMKTNNTSSTIDECEPTSNKWSIAYTASYCGTGSAYSFVNNTAKTTKNAEILFDKAGTYIVTLSEENRCGIFPTSQTIKVKDKPAVAIGKINDICGPVPISITPKATAINCGNSPAMQYAWSFADGTPSVSTSELPGPITFSQLGSHAVTLTVSNECGDSTAKTSFTVVEPPTVSAGADTAMCKGMSAKLHGSATKGKLPYRYLWTSSPIGITYKSPILTVSPTATTNYTLVVTDTAGCTGTSQVAVTINPIPTVTIVPAIICKGEKAELLAQGADAYKWSTGAAIDKISVTPTSSMTYTVTGTKSGCSNTATGMVTVHPLPMVNAGADVSYCNQAITQTLTGYSPLGGSWSGSGITVTGEFTPSAEGTFPLVYLFTNPITTCKNTDTLFVKVIKPEEVDAGTGFSICENHAVTTLTGFKPATNGIWTGPGVSGNTFNPSVAGVGVHTLTYSYGGGSCIKTDTIKISVKPAPKLAVNSPTICAGDSVVLTASGADAYLWSSSEHLSANSGANIYAQPQSTAVVTLIGNATNGCSDSIPSTVSVNPLPIVDAGADQIFCNQNIPVQLNAVAPNVGGQWSGNGVSAAGLFNPSLSQKGSFYIRLRYTNENNCTNNDSIKITVSDVKTADAGIGFAICQNAHPVGLTGYTPLSIGTWTGEGVTDTIFNPSKHTEGIHVLTYSVGAGTCLSSDTIKITVKPIPTLTVNSPTICSGDSVILSALGADIYAWSPATDLSGTIGADVYAKPAKSTLVTTIGTSTISGCSDTAVSKITVIDLPVVDVGQAQSFCNQNIPFQLPTYTSSFGGTGAWSGIGVSPSGVFIPSLAGIGSHYLKLTVTEYGCTDRDSLLATVTAPVFSDAGTGFTICVDAAVLVLSGFTPANGIWSGYGVAGTIFSPSTAGIGDHILTYSVGENTCLTSDTIHIRVHALPAIDIGTSDTTCISNEPFIIADYSPLGGIWSGSGITDGSLGLFSQKIAAVGTVAVKYTYTDAATGCVNAKSRNVTIGALPIVAFSIPTIACSQAPISINNATAGAHKYRWDFGDANSTNAAYPSHKYDSAGYYNISVVAETIYGCIDSLKKDIEIINSPKAQFTQTPSSGCAPLTIVSTNASVGKYLTYEWDMGNGHSTVQENPLSQTYQQGMSDTAYYIRLSATNQCGVTAFTDTVTVYPKPSVQFGLSQKYGCSPVAISFLDNIAGYPDMLAWDFGDGSPRTTSSKFNKETSHTFIYSGDTDTVYTVMLRATNECGYDSTKQQVTIHSNTVDAFFTLDTLAGCEPLTAHFINHSGNLHSVWNFGDGTICTDHDPIYTFTQAGSYIVSLAVNNGCSYDTTQSVPITVYPNPLPKFSFTDSICANTPTVYNNLTTGINGLSWDFGDGSPVSILQNPIHTFTSYGTFNTVLTVENSNGCKSSQEMPVHVRFTPQSSFNVSQTSGCSPLKITFTNSTDSVTYNHYIWNMNNGSSSVLLSPPSKIFTNISHCQDSIYNVMLIANNANCIDTSYTPITVHPRPLSDFNTDNDTYCSFVPHTKVLFKQQSQCANEFKWGINGNAVSSNINFEYSFIDNKAYEVSMIAINQYLCRDTTIKPYIIYPVADSIIKMGMTEGCEPLDALFKTTQPGLSYEWSFGDGAVSTLPDVSHLYQNEGVYSVDVAISSKQGCSTRLSKKDSITVYPHAHANFSVEELNLNKNDGTFLYTNVSADATELLWDLGDGSHSSNIDTVSHRYWINTDVVVTLIANNEYGCPDTVFKKVQPKFFSGLFIPNALNPTSSDDSLKYFKPIGIGLESFHIQVFDTWGNLIWESSALDDQGRPTGFWDGTLKTGTELPMDAYVWKTDRCIFRDGKKWEGMKYNGRYKNTGTVTLIR